MQLEASRPADEGVPRRTQRGDRIMQGLITGSSLSVLLLLAWVHLGLGALLFAPAATPPQIVASSGPYIVTLYTDSGQLVTGDDNVVSFSVRDRGGYPVADATVRVHADMTAMAMPMPVPTATAKGGGRYSALLMFSMAGSWRLAVTVAAPGRATAQVAFDVGVRWP